MVVDALARRDLTSTELEQRLARAGFEADARADAIARAAAAGYLDDARVAVERARRLADATRRTRPSGPSSSGAEWGRLRSTRRWRRFRQRRSGPTRLALRLGGGPRAARALVRKGYAEDVVERAVGLDIAQ